MAFPAAPADDAAPARSRAAAWLADAYRRFAVAIEGYPLEQIGLAALAAGIVLRIAAPFFMDFRADGDTYTAMGHAWAQKRAFLMPWGDVTTWAPTGPAYSNHYPPLYPLYLGVVFTLFGFGLWQAKIAAVVMALAALAVVYWCTRDLYGRVPAALVTGLLALEPHPLWVAGSGFSENMVIAFFTLTMWAILRSLKDDRYILLAGLFAGLAYLSRASVGYFFVVAGAGGFLWRFYFRRWRLFTNLWYMGAILVFLAITGAWAFRNASLFPPIQETVPGWLAYLVTPLWRVPALALAALGAILAWKARAWRSEDPRSARIALAWGALGGAALLAVIAWDLLRPPTYDWAGFATVSVPAWETSSYTRYVQNYAIERPGQWGYALMKKAPFFVGFLAWYAIPFMPEAWRATKRIREEDTSALWLSVFLVWVLALVIAAMFWVFEGGGLYWFMHHRYFLIALVPLAWLIVREARTSRASFKIRYVLVILALFAASGAVFADPIRFSDLRAAEHLDPYLRAGDEVGVDGATIKYAFYAYLSKPEQLKAIYGCETAPPAGEMTGPCHGEADAQGNQADFIVSLRYGQAYPGYQRVADFRQHFSDGGVMTAQLWARDDVVRERGIPTGQTFDYYGADLSPTP